MKIAIDMMEKKSAKYSDRPILPMAGELCGFNEALALLPYGETLRNQRKGFHQALGTPEVIKKYFPHEELVAQRFVKRLLASPDELWEHIR